MVRRVKPPRRALLYGRVSKADRSGKRDSTSVDQQLHLGRQRATAQRWHIVAELRDDGISASRFAAGKVREDWQQAVDMIVSRRCDVLVLWEISRATRDRLPYAMLVAACIDAEVWIDVGGKLHNPADPDDGFILDLQAGLAVRESGVTSKRIKRDVEARALKGTPHGKIPYGYARTYEQRPTGRVLLEQFPDPETAPVVEEIARRLLAGDSAYSIAADLDRRGIPSPEVVRASRTHGADHVFTPWRLETVRDIALSPTAAGLRVHRGEVVGRASWPAIISPADHAALKALLKKEGVRQHRPGTVKHLLSGIAMCGVCGTPLRHTLNRGLPSYWCPGPARRGNGCVCRSKARLDAHVIGRVLQILSDPGFTAALTAGRKGAEDRGAALLRDIANLEAEMAEYVQSAATRAGVARKAFEQVVDRLSAQIEEKQQELAGMSDVPAAVLRFAGPDAAEKWDAAESVDEQRLVVRSLVTVTVHRTSAPKGSRVFDWRTIEVAPRF